MIDLSPTSFLHAPHSREWLNTTRDMLTYIFTYHEVMPAFLDFLFPFGRQEDARDFHFTGFRHETHLGPTHKGFNISELGRSGQNLRMCYSLKSVEASAGQPHWPWSIRQTALYHSLDVETGKATWILIKGNKLMKRRIESSTASSRFRESNDFGTQAKAFAAALATHLIICDWCGDDWRWYINFLEEELQQKTQRTLAVKEESPASPTLQQPSQAPTWSTRSSSFPHKTPFRSLSILKKVPSMAPSEKDPISPGFPDLAGPPGPPGPPPPPPGMPGMMSAMYGPSDFSSDPNDFSFSDLQRVQFIEDKANEVHLVLESNLNVLAELNHHYQTVILSENCPDNVRRECAGDIGQFEHRLASIANDLKMQQSRTKTLLRLLADRKNLVCHSPFLFMPTTHRYSFMGY